MYVGLNQIMCIQRKHKQFSLDILEMDYIVI